MCENDEVICPMGDQNVQPGDVKTSRKISVFWVAKVNQK